MRGVFIRKGSPYYWLRYYDKLEEDPKLRRKEFNTKIPVTEADLNRFKQRKHGEKQIIKGTPELWLKVKELKIALADREFQKETGVKIKRRLLLSEGLKEYIDSRKVPKSKRKIKEKTIESYKLAVKHFINAVGDKYIYQYDEKQYNNLLFYFDKINLSQNSCSIYTRALSTMWKFFVEKGYTGKNIIEAVDSEEKDPEPIELEDMKIILNTLKRKEKHPHHYWLISFMLLIGVRPSSALMQRKENIDYNRKQIIIENIKTGKRKGKSFYKFPLYKELEYLLKEEMKIKEGEEGRLFYWFRANEKNYTWSLRFWKRDIKKLFEEGRIKKKYTLKQLRSTFISYLINELHMDIYTVYKLADHTDIKITDKSYIDFNIDNARKILDNACLISD